MPRLVIKQGEGVGRDIVLSGNACVVGRGPGADFTIEDTLASRRHFQIVQEQGVYWVQDLGSTNGTLVNGRRSERVQLMDGDLIQAGNSQLTFVQKDLLGGAPRAPVKRPPVIKQGQVPPPAAPPAAPKKGGAAPKSRRRRKRW